MNVQYFPGLRCYDSNLLAVMQLEQLDYLQLFSECFNFTVNDGSVIPICEYNIRNQMIESGALLKNIPIDSADLSQEIAGYIQLEMDIFINIIQFQLFYLERKKTFMNALKQLKL